MAIGERAMVDGHPVIVLLETANMAMDRTTIINLGMAMKFTGAVDWIPIGTQFMWTNPASTRFVQASSSSSATLTSSGSPHDDWLVLMNLLGAQGPDSAGNYLIPCGSQMTWNFAGTEGRNYTFSLIQDGTNDGTGFCQPAANDAGDTTNWITGVPFLDQYYIAFHYEANTVGFATRNLGASAASSAPFIG
ncbi:hypothetical protein DACRYDRAFT_105564 [Dacryopinax primogenitus]|uniref:Peptidase A1 domain-containing protein n=1 Tax=Dacryopinax primogenitus (strain DJM 731) TaxID=1858805 RepID=M5GDG2_DACPD|nr:uncharacterized protein DACRYDRAFT_105564 [Dacryopinax primogenitus]EJU04507.1 hypothetical protein DACRYDRAFT_105564 [Dacryopinax primogenitus]